MTKPKPMQPARREHNSKRLEFIRSKTKIEISEI